MINRIEVRNFAVAREVTIIPGPGVTVVTGETGAGKSLVVDALHFALGGKRGREIVASGADRATVTVHLSRPDGSSLVVERAMGRSGRSALTIDGTAARLDDLETALAAPVDIHGQSEQLTILRPAVQLQALDQFANLGSARDEVAAVVRELRDVRRRLREFTADIRERERLIAQLEYELEEITAAALTENEEDALRNDHARLAGVGRLLQSASEALEALDTPAIGTAVAATSDLAAYDDSAGELADMALLLETTAADLARELGRYRDALDDDPERLASVNERLDLLARLRRKYGETLADVIVYGESASLRLRDLHAADDSVAGLEAQAAALREKASTAAAQLSDARRAAASGLVAAVASELALLGMEGAALAVAFACVDDEDGLVHTAPDYELLGPGDAPIPGDEAFPRAFTESGIDRVEFLASFNAGEAARPLGAVASGGETSRFLLALTAVLGAAREGGAVILDEVDEGVGGRAGALVGQALQRLARSHQVICITHLPQVAAFADRHLVVSKQASGSSTWSSIRVVDGDERVDELAAMLGGVTPANRESARELLREAPVSAAP